MKIQEFMGLYVIWIQPLANRITLNPKATEKNMCIDQHYHSPKILMRIDKNVLSIIVEIDNYLFQYNEVSPEGCALLGIFQFLIEKINA